MCSCKTHTRPVVLHLFRTESVVMSDHQPSRRKFIKKAAYITPAILSLKVAPAFAKAGSEKPPKDQPPKDKPPKVKPPKG
jgi:hypothetical protein